MLSGLSSRGARYPSGKGEVCKTFMRRFDSDPRLHSKPVKSPMVKEPLPPQAGGKRRVMTIFPITNAQTADNGKTTKNVTMVNGVAS